MNTCHNQKHNPHGKPWAAYEYVDTMYQEDYSTCEYYNGFIKCLKPPKFDDVLEDLINELPDESTAEEKKGKNSAKKTKQLVSKDEIIYNVPFTKQKSTKKKENVTSNRKLADNSGVISKLPDLFLKKDAPKRNSKTNKMKQNENKFNLFINNIKEKINNISKKTQKKTKTKAIQKKTNSSKLQIKKQATYNKKNVFVRFLYYLKNNVHVLFNSLLIVVFL